MATRRGRIDTRELGLDLSAGLIRFLTGRENLHYGVWEPGVEVCAANLLRAQEAYSRKLFTHLPPGKLRILDIGGGCGDTARELANLGHTVEIVVPSAVHASRCEANAGAGTAVHVMRFEDFPSEPRFDLCLFSESFQYIPIDTALSRAKACLSEGGEILVADCFRTEAFFREFEDVGIVGSGHAAAAFRAALPASEITILHEEDITEAVAPSVELEQQLYNMLGSSVLRVDKDLRIAYPLRRRALQLVFHMIVSRRRRERLKRRLLGDFKSATAFCRYNRYHIFRLKPAVRQQQRNP